MERSLTTRRPHANRMLRQLAAACLVGILTASAVATAQQERPAPRPNVRQPFPQRPYQQNNRPTQPHLGEWLSSHGNLPLAQQQRALQQEPGFRQLRPEEQQRMLNRLDQLSAMSPQRRQLAINRTEAMERLSPDQRQQVRGAMQQLGSLREDRRRAVARAFHDLRSMPDSQRRLYLNSPQYRGQFNDQERSTLNGLFYVSPYLPLDQRAPGSYPAAPAPYPPQF